MPPIRSRFSICATNSSDVAAYTCGRPSRMSASRHSRSTAVEAAGAAAAAANRGCIPDRRASRPASSVPVPRPRAGCTRATATPSLSRYPLEPGTPHALRRERARVHSRHHELLAQILDLDLRAQHEFAQALLRRRRDLARQDAQARRSNAATDASTAITRPCAARIGRQQRRPLGESAACRSTPGLAENSMASGPAKRSTPICGRRPDAAAGSRSPAPWPCSRMGAHAL